MCSAKGYPGIPLGGFPHSGIPGSTPDNGFPRLNAVVHALHRLMAPRHPPYALSSFPRETAEIENHAFYSVVKVAAFQLQRLDAEHSIH